MQWLGKQENPDGYGWAASENYGINIVRYYLMKSIEVIRYGKK